MFAYAPYMLFISSFDGERNPLRNVHGRREISLGAENSAELEKDKNPLRNVHARKEISLGAENSANHNSHGD